MDREKILVSYFYFNVLPKFQTLMTMSEYKFKSENCIAHAVSSHNSYWFSCLLSPKYCSHFLPLPSVSIAASGPCHHVHSCLKQRFPIIQRLQSPDAFIVSFKKLSYLTLAYFSAFSFIIPSFKWESQGQANLCLKISCFILQIGF